MSAFYQGDQYAIPFAIKIGDVDVTSADAVEIKAKLGRNVVQFPNGGLVYSDTAGCWLFPLLQEQSLASVVATEFQAQIKIGNTVLGSNVARVNVRRSIIRDVWSGVGSELSTGIEYGQPISPELVAQFELPENVSINFRDATIVPGPHYTPDVDEDGWLTWTNNGGLPNPEPVNIKGPPGGGGGTWSDLEGKPFTSVGENLKVVNGVLDVDTAPNVQQDNTKPITSAAVYVEVGNINALLSLI